MIKSSMTAGIRAERIDDAAVCLRLCRESLIEIVRRVRPVQSKGLVNLKRPATGTARKSGI